MVENIKQSEFNKNVIQVYTQEANFTGYKGFDFTAIDDLEYLIRQQLIPYTSGIKSSLDEGVNTNQLDLNYITDNVSISGRALTYLSGIADAGVNVNQLDLNYITDNVSISGQALSYLSGMVNQGINVNQADLNYITDNVSISGQALSYLSGIAVEGVSLKGVNTVNVNVTGGSLNVLNEVEIKNEINNPVPVIGTVTASLSNYNIFSSDQGGAQPDLGIRLGFSTQTVGGEDYVRVAPSNPLPIAGTVEPVRTNIISNYTIVTINDDVISSNSDRKELYVQNLSNNILYVKYGSAADSTSFNFILSANSVVDAGDGGILTDQNYNGLVSVSGVSPRFIAWERTSYAT